MRACDRAHWGILLLCLLFSVSSCSGDEKTVSVEVVGTAECADCKTYNIKSTQAFSGLRVSAECKLENGETKRMGDADIDKDGKFKISLSHEPDQNCYAQLHSAAAVPCPALDASKIVLKSQTDAVKSFGVSTKLQFSAPLCASKTFSSYFHYPPLPPLSPHPWLKSYHSWPPLPPLSPHPWLKSYHSWPPLPPLSPHPWLKGSHSWPPLPPLFHHKQPPVPVVYTPPVVNPLPPPAPVYTPSPVYKPKPTVPVYKPKPPVPVYKPKPTVPVYKPKPPVPVYKPKPPVPVYKPNPPVSKPAPEVKPLPPAAPTYKPPCPPLPKLPPLPQIPPKYFHHPKYGFNFPPLPPHHP